MSVKSFFSKVVDVLKKEPVAVWGVVLAAILGLLPLVGVPASTVVAIGAVLSLLGIPVVRGQVTPLAALEALIEGWKAENAALKARVAALETKV
jgi:hypothetical protein